MTIWTEQELKDIHRDLDDFNSYEGWIAMEALLELMQKELIERRDDK